MHYLQCCSRSVVPAAVRVAVRHYSQNGVPHFSPQHTDYYSLDPSDAEVAAELGTPRVERTKLEAAARKIAESLFLHDEANRALLEQELEQDGDRYLRGYVDTRDAQPPAVQMSSAKVSNKLFGLLGPPAQRRASQTRNVLGDVAKFMATHQVVKLSDYHRMVRWLLMLNHPDAAADIMETLLMSRQGGFGTSTFSLCLELALVRRDARQFADLAKRVKWKRNQWFALQRKFDAPDFNVRDPSVVKRLAEGYLMFNRTNDLTYLMKNTPGLTAGLLTINMLAAAKWGDIDRAQWSLTQFSERLDGMSGAAIRSFLAAADKVPALRDDISYQRLARAAPAAPAASKEAAS